MCNKTKNRIKTSLSVGLVSSCLLFSSLVSAGAKIEIDDTKWISIGGGVRTLFQAREDAAGNGDDYSNDFNIDSVRLYFNGQIHENIKFTVNTECATAGPRGCSEDPDMELLDAIARFEFNPQFNVWAGRMLVPADRIEMNGPYYALSWNQYTVPLLPSDSGGPAGEWGRDEGVTVWGTQSKFQYALGVFDGLSGAVSGGTDNGANVDDNLLYAGRFAYNFLNPEGNPAYYTSSTYYGAAGDVFTLGFSFNQQSDGVGTEATPGDFEAYIFDFLFEKPLTNQGVVTIEGEYKVFDSDDIPETITAANRRATAAVNTARTNLTDPAGNAALVAALDQANAAVAAAPTATNLMAALDARTALTTPAGNQALIDALDDANAAAVAPAAQVRNCFCLFDGESYFITAGYLFPQDVGIGKLQPYVRYNENMPDSSPDSDLLELGVNYIISGHNARLNANWQTGDANITGLRGADVDQFQVGLQLQY